MEAVATLLEAGKIRAAGVSNFTAEEIDAASRVVPLASDQPPYSMLRRDIEADVVPYCIENNIGLVVYSPLQLGLLTGKVGPDREFPEGDQRAGNPMFSAENRRRVGEFLAGLQPIADKYNLSIVQLVLVCTLAHPAIHCPIVGIKNPAQIEEVAGAMGKTIGREDYHAVRSALS